MGADGEQHMTTVVKIDGEAVGVEEFMRVLKLTGQFDQLLDQFVRDRLTARSARQAGIQVSASEIQERADQFRKEHGLHRASDTNKYLDRMRVTLEEFEAFITDTLYQEKMLQEVCGEQAVQGYFKLNSPRFDSIELSHVVLDSEARAREMMAVLEDDPGSFEEMAREHSIAATRSKGGLIGKVLRGALRPEVEAKVFAAAAGALLGPFATADAKTLEIFRVNARHPGHLDDETANEVRRLLRAEWLRARVQEHVVEL
jgi:parvulin-like peptidyl-prolyl isomerase